MSWVSSERMDEKLKDNLRVDTKTLSMLRGALVDEISATDLYSELIDLLPRYRDDLKEIRDDELNHQGKLLKLIMTLDKSQAEHIARGLKQEE